jgi:hypothetical protein
MDGPRYKYEVSFKRRQISVAIAPVERVFDFSRKEKHWAASCFIDRARVCGHRHLA